MIFNHETPEEQSSRLNNEIVDITKELQLFHSLVDPTDMMPEEYTIWEKWDREFHPENYDDY